jgi:serine/threonine-protein kinase
MISEGQPPDRQAGSPLTQALAEELSGVGRLVGRAWLVLSVLGAILGFAYEARAPAATALVLAAWFAFVSVKSPHPVLGSITSLAETIVPWTFATQIGWAGPALYFALVLSLVVRLRPLAPLAAGGVALSAQTLLPSGELWMGLGLLTVGGIGSLAVMVFSNSLSRAESTARERELFGKYRIVRPLASGGMGAVFDAVYQPEGGFERRVALKRIHAHLAAQERFLGAFRAEAELLSHIAHPNVVQVLDFGKVGESYFLSMEYVDGVTLSEFMERARRDKHTLAPELVGYLGRELLAGLAHAHTGARGTDGTPLRIVHRDLCPQNVLLSRNGEVKISDFGVARALKDSDSTYTQTVVGHIAYMAPEQTQPGQLDPRADLFPVAAILWELLVGRSLFMRGNESATLMALMYDEVVPVSLLRTGLDPGWDDLIRKGLERDPAQRFTSAHQMAEALDAIAESRSAGSPQRLAEIVSALVETPPALVGEQPTTEVDG